MPNDWSFYDVVIGIIALLFTLIGAGWALYERFKNVKGLRYLSSKSTSLILDRPNIGQLSITYNRVKVEDPQITSIECSNNGRLSITPDDFIEHLTISGKGKVLSATVSQVNPEGLQPSISFTDNQVVIKPLLLNGGDTFTINVLTDGEYSNPKMSARIIGVKDIRRIANTSENTKAVKSFFLGIAVPIVLFVIILIVEYKTGLFVQK